MPRRARGVSIDIGIRKDLIQLAELVFEVALGLLDALGSSGGGDEDGQAESNQAQGRRSLKMSGQCDEVSSLLALSRGDCKLIGQSLMREGSATGR